MKITRIITGVLLGLMLASSQAVAADQVATNVPVSAVTSGKKLPKLLDLGATKCIPCKKMAPILEALKQEYAGKLEVEFIDVWKDPEPAKKCAIKLIPTQIFYNADGKELFRHEGFFGKEDILAKWKELGVKLDDAQ